MITIPPNFNPKTPNRNLAHAYGDIAHAFKHLSRVFKQQGFHTSAREASDAEDEYLALAVKAEHDANINEEDA